MRVTSGSVVSATTRGEQHSTGSGAVAEFKPLKIHLICQAIVNRKIASYPDGRTRLALNANTLAVTRGGDLAVSNAFAASKMPTQETCETFCYVEQKKPQSSVLAFKMALLQITEMP